ncbi:5-methyltetrahydropteroyltriglutamate--homocysteine S-methyltransferase [Enterobacteriaceae endosymbiont of Donacia tomentosa]|uniref:5-methyltetrahydropteroyltriglutamate-- homocysteine S-methyltransferase n=1 Tax=Enterobacteriaceae endosymbiont of Donacia tomentosa TaxID=2675787 RepID=UPI001449CE51|nr:5-methyltetrahydropteroyltriglutamate--homocysteine S-methyltransferase [Enterobacteriaceae endosymbiont of Donacia tomentosa]QJC31492.1 5-methyltetrahydropteroyltriglutamate--homocysteine S-methyltransferase [Enterobacteriaceae endosymbiont of Donacia tomentosa]
MNVLSHILGFPRIGKNRELKKSLEKYWNNKISKTELLNTGFNIRKFNFKQQKNNLDLLSVGDFAWYDHVLNTSLMLGNIPLRYSKISNLIDINTMFNISRGTIHENKKIYPSDMTKWFNTNYHYIVPEFYSNQSFNFSWKELLEEIDEAIRLGYKNLKPIILGPLTYLWLGKIIGKKFDRLMLIKKILPIYIEILTEISNRKISWIQIDEPILSLELPNNWLYEFRNTYKILNNHFKKNINILLTTYFGGISHNIELIKLLPISGIHLDFIHGNDNISFINDILPKEWILSCGIINGRNIWKTNLKLWYEKLLKIKKNRENLWISTSCSLLHSPIDLNTENNLPKRVKELFSFAIQKCYELLLLKEALQYNDLNKLIKWNRYTQNFSQNTKNNQIFQKKIVINDEKKINSNRISYTIRSVLQKQKLKLPLFPITTIGSFPQTKDIRKIRSNYKLGLIDYSSYEKNIKKHIKDIVNIQEKLDLDILVHGEPERNDMVEYFGENLNGFIITENGWVQSYGSRCVKPPIIFSDINRNKPITVKWIKYAQSLTTKIVKGMLTGPMTIFLWSFPREDITPIEITKQISLVLKEEILDLEKANIKIIQIDEPALREGLPLKKSEWKKYLQWAVTSFKLVTSNVQDTTQIHTHMCYSEFKDIINDIIALDADVISIETSRSSMDLIKLFKYVNYPNGIGLGVYDIHSPNIPSIKLIKNFLKQASQNIPMKNIWVNPDCGLKTRNWEETVKSLYNMVYATKILRNELKD